MTMTRAPRLPFGVSKEIRALLPIWLACIVAMGVVAVLGDRRVYEVGVLAYFLGSVALGALSIGHEYTHGTLALLLSQPVHRGRLLLTKLGVLTPMLLVLAAVAWAVLFNPRELRVAYYWAENSRGATVLFVSVLCGLFIAPWLTMLCRSPLAGVVFTIVVPAAMWIVSDVLAVAKYGLAATSTPDVKRFELAIFSRGMLGFCAVAAVLSWRMFSRLEAIEGRDPEVQMPRWLLGRTATIATPAAHVRSRHPFWRLVKKELRLQQMTFVVAGLYLMMCVTLSLLRRVVPGFSGPAFFVITFLYSGILALLIGSLASAEERQFGTLEWQVLLPLATWKQWAVKVGTALSLVILLGLGLPAFLSYMIPAADIRITAWDVGAIIVLTTGSLYVSSLCSSGLWALLLSFPVLVGVVLLAGPFAATVVEPLARQVIQVAPSAWRGGRVTWLRWLRPSLPFVLAGTFLAVVLRFALVNHRSAERSASRVWRQVSWMVGCLTLGVTLLVVVLRFYL